MLRPYDGIGIDHERAFLTSADMRVEFPSLAIGQPDRHGKVLAESGHPQGVRYHPQARFLRIATSTGVKFQNASGAQGGLLCYVHP